MAKKNIQDWESEFREAIKQSGMTPYEIGKRSGVDVSQIYRLMDGTRGLSLKSAQAVAEVVGIRLVRGKS